MRGGVFVVLALLGCGELSLEGAATLDKRCPGVVSAGDNGVVATMTCAAAVRREADPVVNVVGGIAGQISAARGLLDRGGQCPGGDCGAKAGVGVAQERQYTSVRAVCPDCTSRSGSDSGPGRGGTRWERVVVSPRGGSDPPPKTVIEVSKPRHPAQAEKAQFDATWDAGLRAGLRDNSNPTGSR